nr:selectin P [Salvelinus malma]
MESVWRPSTATAVNALRASTESSVNTLLNVRWRRSLSLLKPVSVALTPMGISPLTRRVSIPVKRGTD